MSYTIQMSRAQLIVVAQALRNLPDNLAIMEPLDRDPESSVPSFMADMAKSTLEDPEGGLTHGWCI